MMKSNIMMALCMMTFLASAANAQTAKANAKASNDFHPVNSHNNTNTNTATGGDATGGTATSSATGGNATGGTGGDASASNGGQSVAVVDNAKTIPVSTAYSASLTSGLDTCLGSGSAGLQTMGIGLTGGKTYVDKNCVLTKNVQLLLEMHLPQAACYRARIGEEGKAIDDAMKAAGVDCGTYEKPVETPVAVVEPIDTSKFVTHEEFDRAFKRTLAK